MQPNYQYQAKVDRVIDGDTVDAIVDLGFHVNTKIRCRLARINAVELKDIGGKEAKIYVETLLPVGATIFLHSTKLDKYGRSIADIFVNGENLTDLLLLTKPEWFKSYP